MVDISTGTKPPFIQFGWDYHLELFHNGFSGTSNTFAANGILGKYAFSPVNYANLCQDFKFAAVRDPLFLWYFLY
jgi:hypothetical protein